MFARVGEAIRGAHIIATASLVVLMGSASVSAQTLEADVPVRLVRWEADIACVPARRDVRSA